MTDSNTSAPGFNLLSFSPLTGYSPEAVLYAVLNNTDHTVTLADLVSYVLSGVAETQIPSDVVRRLELESYVAAQIAEIIMPSGGDITESNLANKVSSLEDIVALKSGLDSLVESFNDLTIPSTVGFIKAATGLQTNKAIVLNEDGELINTSLGSLNIFHVVGRVVADGAIKDGSLENPFTEIQEAIDAIPVGSSNILINVMPSEAGDYQGFSFTGTNLVVSGYGCTDAHNVRIVGSIAVEGDLTTRFRLKDIQVRQASASVPAYHSKGTLARDYFKNVTFEPFSSSQAQPVVVLEDVKNWIDFEDCNIGGKVSIIGTATGSALVAMRAGNADTTHITLDSEVKLLINNCTRFGSIDQKAGTVEVNYSHTFTGKDGYALTSSGGTASMSYTNLKKGNGFLKIKRSVGLSPVVLTSTSTGPTSNVEGPVVYSGTEQLATLTNPVFDLSMGAVVEGVRSATLKRVATKGYYFESLSGSIVQTEAGADPLDGGTTTPFTVAYADKELGVSYPHTPSLPEVYVILTDGDNDDAVFVYGPFINTEQVV